ncbi:MAG: CHAT domain-containing protein [Saprospiraceae bacterium]|nr:CHAT domain-containing protein [Saprospiraceae bacterium]
MKPFLLTLLLLPACCSLLTSQIPDSAAVRKTIDSLLNASDRSAGGRQFERSIRELDEAEKLTVAHFGKNHPMYAKCLLQRGINYAAQGLPRAKEAEPWLIAANALYEQTLGLNNLETARSLYFLGMFYWEESQFDKALQYARQSRDIVFQMAGTKHPGYVYANSLVAKIFKLTGKYWEAVELLEANLTLLVNSSGKNNPQYVDHCMMLGEVYQQINKYDRAELLFMEASAIIAQGRGKKSPEYVQSLLNLIGLYGVMGHYEKILPHLTYCAETLEKTIGRENDAYYRCLLYYAMYYNELRENDKARQVLSEARPLCERLYGKEHSRYAILLQVSGKIWHEDGFYAPAEADYVESLGLFQKVYPDDPIAGSATKNNLAALYFQTGRVAQADSLLSDLNRRVVVSMGVQNEYFMRGAANLGRYHLHDQPGKSAGYLTEASNVRRQLLAKEGRYLSERQLNGLINHSQWISTLRYNHAGLHANRFASITRSCFDDALFFKGYLLDHVSRLQKLASSDTLVSASVKTIRSCAERLAYEYKQPKQSRDSALIAGLEDQVEQLEKTLMRTVDGYAEEGRQVTFAEVKNQCGPQEAVIEFVHFPLVDRKTDQTDTFLYAALLVRANDSVPVFIPLFEDRQLDSLLLTGGARRFDYVSTLYSLADRGAEPVNKPRKTLYELVWKPIEPHLNGVHTIYYAPSGLLHRINLGAIPLRYDSVLADRYDLVQLGSTRQRVVPTRVNTAQNDAVLFGGIRYEADSVALAVDALADSFAVASRSMSREDAFSFAGADSTLRNDPWKYLPFTEKEATAIAGVLRQTGVQTRMLSGYQATEEAFKSIGANKKTSPRILHLATHGYFFPDPRGVRNTELGMQNMAASAFRMSEHPMIRSGLILAGGNHAWASGKPIRPDMEDGILTAYEISRMNLSNTELVVLSACETGLGDIQGNEGVYGLQRAFKIAGAKYLIMSLWQVPDMLTSRLMTSFYQKWLEEKMDIPQAFRAAQADLRAEGHYPFFWAGFVLVE